MASTQRREQASYSLADRTGIIGSVARFWQKTYAPDYVGLALLLAAYIVMELVVEPFHRMFAINNIALAYPHALHERVPLSSLFLYASGVPLLVLIAWLAISRSSVHKFHVTILAFAISIILTTFITDVIKNAVGRPRPDLVDRCKPAAGTPIDTLVTFEVCTETDHHTLHDGWRSFPSGHSSFAFSGLGYLALFLSGQTGVFRPRSDLGRALLSLSPLLGAALIAISRCEDYRHDVYDVTVGSILGFAVAYFSYRRYYPRLRSPKCAEPFPSRETMFNEGFSKIKNDEENLRNAREFSLEDEDEDDE